MIKLSTKKIVLLSFLVDLTDIATNLVVAFISGSAVIFAGLVQGLADSVGSFLLVVGYKQSRRPKDTKHPFGYSREIFFWALLSSTVMLFFGSGLSIWRGYQQFIQPEILHYKWVVLAVLCFSFSTNGFSFWQGFMKIKKKGVPFLRTFHRSPKQLVKTTLLRDSLGVLSAVVGIISIGIYDFFGIIIFDALGAMTIGFLIAFFAIILISQARYLIAGESVSDDYMLKIKYAVSVVPGVSFINRLIAVYTGSDHIMVDLDIDLKDSLTTNQIEDLFDQIQHSVKTKVPEVDKVWIDLNTSKDA